MKNQLVYNFEDIAQTDWNLQMNSLMIISILGKNIIQTNRTTNIFLQIDRLKVIKLYIYKSKSQLHLIFL